MGNISVASALISVYDKSGLDVLVKALSSYGVTIYSTGGTYTYIASLGIQVVKVEDITGFPSMLDGRVKTLHPAVFAGILARRDEDHLSQLKQYDLPRFDMVVVDLYPFEETVRNTTDESQIIEKIDIGGVSLLRAAAKNYTSVAVISQRSQYEEISGHLQANEGKLTLVQRRELAYGAFEVTAHYDRAITDYFGGMTGHSISLRYGENPHQHARFIGNLKQKFHQLNGKALSYNNLVDVDSALGLIAEFKDSQPTFAIIKHTNPCGIATRPEVIEAWNAALECDPNSAFGGIIVSNVAIDEQTADAIDQLFYEVLIAPGFGKGVAEKLSRKKNRIILQITSAVPELESSKDILGGRLIQQSDYSDSSEPLIPVSKTRANHNIQEDMQFAIKCVKHLKSNAIAIVKKQQMIGSGQGQTSRVSALSQAIAKMRSSGFDPKDAVLSSDAFFPFSDSVAMAHEAGIMYIVQPGGSVKDQESIDYCDANNISMYFTGIRHFKH